MSRYSKEQAAEVLENPPELKEHREYFEAIRNDTLPQYYRGRLTEYRHGYSDELPDVDVRTLTITQEKRFVYKCQTNVTTGIGTTLQAAVKDGVIKDQRTKRAIKKLLKSDLNFQPGDPDNQKRIDFINKTLDRAIKKLS